jgi:hypothetical protein
VPPFRFELKDLAGANLSAGLTFDAAFSKGDLLVIEAEDPQGANLRAKTAT